MRRLTETGLQGFSEFWSVYPRKVAKKDAMKAWAALDMSPELLKRILKAVIVARASDQWKKDGGQYVPYAGTYIRGERWDDVHEVEIDEVRDGKAWNESVTGVERMARELGMTWTGADDLGQPETWQQWARRVAAAFNARKVVPIGRAA